jgi:AhpC/TSA antioxidant enzyme
MDTVEILRHTQRKRVGDGEIVPILSDCESFNQTLIIVLPQLGDFDSMEYAWWLQRETLPPTMAIRLVGIGDRSSGQRFCEFTGFNPDWLFVDPNAELHKQLGLYAGLSLKLPLLSNAQNAWLNLMLMCAGIGSPGTLAEVLRGYIGDRSAPQLIGSDEEIKAFPLPVLKGSFFNLVGGSGFQRPIELATLRLRNMSEVLSHWGTYVPNADFLAQRGGTFLIDNQGQVLYEHRDRGILGFAENMNRPLSFLTANSNIEVTID